MKRLSVDFLKDFHTCNNLVIEWISELMESRLSSIVAHVPWLQGFQGYDRIQFVCGVIGPVWM